MENRDLKTSSWTSLISVCPLPEDVILEILTRLDVKSLCLLKLVSRGCNAFLSLPSFSLLYSQKKPPITAFFYQTSKDYPQKLQYVLIDPKDEPIFDPPSCLGFLDYPVFLRNSCNGLLHWSSTEGTQRQHFISNPLTNKFVEISWPINSNELFASGIVFNPALSDHFRVVVLAVRSQQSLKLKVFSSETMRWDKVRRTLAFDTRELPFCPDRGVFLNGFLYWESNRNALIAYNVDDQHVHLMKLPLMSELNRNLGFEDLGCLGESRGRLHYCRVMDMLLSVWVANQKSSDNSVDWVHQYSVNLSNVMCEGPSIIRPRGPNNSVNWVHQHLVNLSNVTCEGPSIIRPRGARALAFLDGCECVLVGVEGKVMAYLLNGGGVREVCKVRRNGFTSGYLRPSEFFPFVHSLALSNLPSKRIDELSTCES
ncbi:uncharacterized protein LOC130754687 [Actinidia eriantha]|uniref:uncharacterized protein LOC130754687 n=1 Tax=Actinidia eriantha TaxID=165200 RepID=UPI00258F670E|nr:uncharacterized protein LOC130754687 [Actinidia eriantha]